MKVESEMICPKCKTGHDSFKLDPKSTECPYLYCHTGKSCSMFAPIENEGSDPDGSIQS